MCVAALQTFLNHTFDAVLAFNFGSLLRGITCVELALDESGLAARLLRWQLTPTLGLPSVAKDAPILKRLSSLCVAS